MRSSLTVIIITGALALPAQAQSVPVGDPIDDYARLLQVGGQLPVSTVTARPLRGVDAGRLGALGAAHPWAEALRRRYPAWEDSSALRARLLPIDVGMGFNSARPWGFNDGARWQAKGGNAFASGGVEVRWGRVTAVVRPVAVWSQNADFALSPLPVPAGLSPFAYPTGSYTRIDAPQRFGPDAFRRVDLGESYVRADLGAVALGLSNESQWWGPGRRNAILLTNNAPGFGHAWLGTGRPLDLKWLTVEAKWTWGRLTESRWFDAADSNDLRFHTGAVVVARPRFAPGLELGASRIFVQDWRPGGPSVEDLAVVFLPLEKSALITPENPTGDDARDQMAALFARWVFPESGFEVYGEWARGDHGRDFRDLLVEPEHASGYTAGFQKTFARDTASARWRVGGELTLLGVGRPSFLRAPSSAFYVHHIIRQGYTQRGQVMGAGIGPGGSQLSFTVDRFARWGKVGVGALRTVYDNDRFYTTPRSHHTHEVEPTFLADVLWFRGAWDLSATVASSRLLNKWYIERNDERNLHLQVGARWHPGR